MSKLTETVYVTLEPAGYGYAARGDQKPVSSFRATGMRKNPPPTKAGEIIIKLRLSVDSSLFEEYIPVVIVDIDERSVMPRVEVIDPSEIPGEDA